MKVAVSSARVWLGILGAFCLLLPLVVSSFYVNLVTEFLIAALFAVSYNLVFGFGGMVSIGHAAFFGIGAYGCGLLLKAGVSLPLAMLAAMAMATLYGLVVGYFCVRLRMWLFAFLTLAFAQVIWVVVWQWYDVTGGEPGLIGVPVPAIFSPTQPWRFYYFALVLVAAGILILRMIVNSPFGLVLRATRDSWDRAESIGINVPRHRLLAFALSGVFSSLSGVLLTLFLGGAFPDWAFWLKSAEPQVMSMLGGMFTFTGPVAGAAVMVFLQSFATRYTEHWMLFLGSILVLVIIAFPSGLMGSIQQKFQAHKQG